MNTNPLLSIVSPVYNVGSYLERCVRSILAQDFVDWELILVDDGSDDGSAALCDNFAATDRRIVVIHQPNGGVSAARNTALEVAKGDYLTFVDPDDFLASDTYRPNMDYLLAHPETDLLQYPYCEYTDGEARYVHRPAAAVLKGARQLFLAWWSGSPLEYVIWNKIYRRSLWDGIRFRVGHVSEDTMLVAQLVRRVRVARLSEQGLYYYQRNREDSYTFTYSFDKHLDLFQAHAVIYGCFDDFPDLVTERVLAFTRLFRRLITACQTDPSADISEPLQFVGRHFPSWRDIMCSQGTEKRWLAVAKLLGPKWFTRLFVWYLGR